MRKGFTIVEVIMVIVLIGIFSSIAIPKLSGVYSDAVGLSDTLNKRTEDINKAREYKGAA